MFAGWGRSAYLARQVGQKRAREIFFLRRDYSAQQAFEMEVNAVVPSGRLETMALEVGHKSHIGFARWDPSGLDRLVNSSVACLNVRSSV